MALVDGQQVTRPAVHGEGAIPRRAEDVDAGAPAGEGSVVTIGAYDGVQIG